MSSSPAVHCEALPNGLTLLLREARLAPVASLQVWAGVGSADERPDEAGLAHFHEHMLFKGTRRRGVGDIAGEVEGAGGRINAYTTFDATVYYATLPSDALATAVDVLSDAVRHSVFDPEEVAREREVVLEEIRRSDDSPAHVLGDALFRTVYREHPYGAPILGSPESVSSFDRDKVVDFFSRWYTPDRITVVAAGDFDPARLADSLKEVFGDAEPGPSARARPAEPRQQALRTVVLRRSFERVRLDLAWRSCAFSSPDATHLDLLSYILGECESSRLVARVKDGLGLVDRIESSSYTPYESGMFSVHTESDGTRSLQALEAIAAELESLRHERVSSEELERARANFLASELYERESVSGMASKLGNFQVIGGDWRGEAAYLASLRSASAEDLLQVANEYLVPEALSVAALLPEDEAPELTTEALQDAAAHGFARGRRRFARPSRRSDPDTAEIHGYQLEGGARLYVVPRREVPVVAGRAAFVGGLLAEDAGSAGLSSFLSSMWIRGTRSRSAADFARAVEDLASDVDGFSGRSSLGVTFDATVDKLAPTLDLFAEVLLEPGFDEDELERERRETLAGIERREDRLAQQAFLLFTETLFRTHPYRLPISGHRHSVESFDAAKLAAHHERLIRAENLVLAVAGDIDPDHAAEALSRRLADLPSGGFQRPRPAPDPAPEAIRREVRSKGRAQAHLVVGFPGLSVADPERHTLEVISQLLAGQGGRLFLDLRDRRSLAYSVSAMNVEGLEPGFFAIYIASAPEKVDEARAGILEHLSRLVSEPPSAEELDRARRYLAGNAAIEQQRNASHAAHTALDALYGIGADASRDYARAVSAVSADDVLRVARQVIRLDAYTEALID